MTALPPRLNDAIHSLTGADLTSLRGWWYGAEAAAPGDAAGPRANQRLTALAGALVLPLAALVLLTGLFFGSLWHIHYFVGYLLLPVVVVKLLSTGYRMVRYYLRSGAYRLIRPPYPLGRIISPLLVACVLVLFASGIIMWLTHSQADPWGWLHTDAAVVFCGIVLVHLGMYLPEALRGAGAEMRSAPVTRPAERSRRLAVLGVAVLAGLVLGVATIGFSKEPARSHRDRRDRPPAAATAPRAASFIEWAGSA